MKKTLLTLLLLTGMLATPALAEGIFTPNALLYDNSTIPLTHFANPNVKADRLGLATCKSYFWIYTKGECGINDAMVENDIKRVSFVDRQIKSFLTLYKEVTIKVYGEQ